MPRMRHTALGTIHLRPPLANTWTRQGLLPAAWKVTAVVGWRPVDAMTDVAPLARRDDQYGGPVWRVGSDRVQTLRPNRAPLIELSESEAFRSHRVGHWSYAD